jgi:hypothetical protein
MKFSIISYMEWYIYDNLEKAKLQGQKRDQWVPEEGSRRDFTIKDHERPSENLGMRRHQNFPVP